MKFKRIISFILVIALFSSLSAFANANEEYELAVSAENGTVSGGGRYASGEEVTLVAEAFSGYHFLGWYKDSAIIPESMSLTYKVTVSADAEYKAKFTENDGTFNLSIQLGGGKVTYTVNSKETELRSSVENVAFPQGTRFLFKAAANEGYRFLYWRDAVSGRIITYSAETHLTLASDTRLQAVFVSESSNYSVFIDRSGKVLKASGMVFGQPISAPESVAVYQGYKFTGWDKEYATPDGITLVNALYEKEDKKYSVSVVGGYLNEMGKTSGVFAFDTPVTVAADVPNGKYFAGWSYDGGKTVVSYSSVYSFLVGESVTLAAVYSDEESEKKPTVSITSIVRRENEDTFHRVSVMSQWSVPEGYKFVETGLIRTTDATYGNALALATVNDSTIKLTKFTKELEDGQYMVHIDLSDSSKTAYVRAYLTYVNEKTGKVHTVYSLSASSASGDVI